MATINLGRIKPVFQGAYNNATSYVVDDIVTFEGQSFICILASTGNATSNATYWTLIAKKGADVTQLTTQGDILYRDGTGVARLAAGTAGQVLQTSGAGCKSNLGKCNWNLLGQLKLLVSMLWLVLLTLQTQREFVHLQ